MARIRSAERSAATTRATAITSTTISTSTIPTSTQQPRGSSRTRTRTCTTRRLRSSVGPEGSQRQSQSSSIPLAQQSSVARRTHIGKHLRSSIDHEGQQGSQPTSYQPGRLPKRRRIPPSPRDSQPTNYQPGQVQQQTKPHTRPTKPLQPSPSSSRPKYAQNSASPRRPVKHGPPSNQPHSTKCPQPTPFPIPPPPQPGSRLLIHTSAPRNPSQDALYQKQAVAVLRGFGAAAYMSLSSTSFELGPPYGDDEESIPDRQVDPGDAWMDAVREEELASYYDEDLEAMFRRFDVPRVEAAKLENKPQKEVEVEEGKVVDGVVGGMVDEVIMESPPEVSEDDSQQYAQRREKLPAPRRYSSGLGFLLPDVESWEGSGGSIPESQAQDGNTVEVPSSPILPQNREDVNVDGEEMGMHVPSSQPGESVKGIAGTSFPEILTGDLTSPEFLTSESVKGGRGAQKGKGKGKQKDFRGQAGLSSPAYQVLRESALNTPAPQRQRSSQDILSTPPPLQGNKRKRGGGRSGSIGSQGQARAQAQAVPRSPAAQSPREAGPTPHSVAAPTRFQTTEKPSQEAPTPPVRGSRIEKAKRDNAKGRSKSQITFNAPALQLSQLKSASQPTPGRYTTRSYSRQKQIEILPPPAPLFSPPPIRKRQTPPPPSPPPLPKRNREFFYAPPAPTPLHLDPLSPSQLLASHPSTASSLPLTHLPPFSPPLHLPKPPPLSTLVPRPHAILPPDLCPNEVNTDPLQVTSYLARLEEKPHTWVPYFKPVVRRRELRDWERGCWVVDLSASSSSSPSLGFPGGLAGASTARWQGRREKIQFWDKLRGNVLEGRLGMVGVFLGSEDGEGAEAEGGDTVKVYCWGKVAELVWAFLFVISDRRTKVGLRWVDAGGQVVIQC